MIDKLSFRFKNEEGFLSQYCPIVWSADIKRSIVYEVAPDKLDYDYIRINFLDTIEHILSEYSINKYIILAIYLENDEFYNIILEPSPVGVSIVGKIVDHTIGAKIDTTTRECIANVINNIADELQDIYLRSVAAESVPTVIEKIKGVLNNASSNFNSESSLEELCNKISSETKAEIVKPKESLKDYVCNDLLRTELEEIVDFFDNAKAYKDANVDIPKGILFKGPWGTGKTYAARCIAGTVDCYFMTCTASALQGMYIGSGAENIRQVFKGAKLLAEKSKKGVILFIDELDSFGDRQNRTGGASGEEDRTLNQLLAEMSGFDTDTDVMVLAATNFPERLDSALMRSGRFGRQITIDYPDDNERFSLVKYYFSKKNIALDSSVSYDDIANLTKGLTPADIKEISNEAGILSIRHKKGHIDLEDVNEAINKVITKNIRHPDKSKEELYLITAHECGHVLAEYICNKTVPIKVTNYAYGNTGGFTQSAEVMSGIIPQNRYLNEIKILLGGRAAEEVICGYITNGASNDLDKAKKLLYSYYKHYNFEAYEHSKLDQLVLDRIDTLYTEIVKTFKEPKIKECLNKLTTHLLGSRVLYTMDLVIDLDVLKGENVCL